MSFLLARFFSLLNVQVKSPASSKSRENDLKETGFVDSASFVREIGRVGRGRRDIDAGSLLYSAGSLGLRVN